MEGLADVKAEHADQCFELDGQDSLPLLTFPWRLQKDTRPNEVNILS